MRNLKKGQLVSVVLVTILLVANLFRVNYIHQLKEGKLLAWLLIIAVVFSWVMVLRRLFKK